MSYPVAAPWFTPADSDTASARDFFREQGYIVVREALSGEEVEALRREASQTCRGQMSKDHPELDAGVMPDEDVLARYLCIHFPHKSSELMLGTLAHRSIVRVLEHAIGPDVKCMQSMLFIKSAGKPGQAWHQDENFIPTRDRSLTGAWIALDDATTTNGCLWVIPGSHRPGVLWPQYPHNDPSFDCTHESYDFPYADSEAVPVEVPAGSVVFFNGYLLHRSLPNKATSGFRRALVLHYMSAQSLLPWTNQEGVPIAKCDDRDVVMVCGTDPYAWKGLRDTHRPHVRPAGEGGCSDGREPLDRFRTRPLSERSNL